RQAFPRRTETERRLQDSVRLRAEWSGERRCATGGFFNSGAAWQMSQVRRPHLRIRNELCLRKFSWYEQNVRLSIGQSHLATFDRSRTGEQTAHNRQDRFA